MRRLVSKFKESGEDKVPRHKYGGGKPAKICTRTLRVIRFDLEKNPSITAKQIKEKNASFLQGVSERSIQRAIRNKLKYKKVGYVSASSRFYRGPANEEA